MSAWTQIARAYESGWTPPTRPKRPNKKVSLPRYITVGGESKRMIDWYRDERNVYGLAPSTIAKRAEIPENLTSVEVFLRAPHGGGQ
jgi:hypothetical protein